MHNNTGWLFFLGLVWGTVFGLMLGVAIATNAKAHEWYPPNCCSGQDCKAVPQEDLEEQPDGTWKYLPNGAHFTKKQTYPSQDTKWHVCYQDASIYDDSGQTPPGTPIPMCVFIQMGF